MRKSSEKYKNTKNILENMIIIWKQIRKSGLSTMHWIYFLRDKKKYKIISQNMKNWKQI